MTKSFHTATHSLLVAIILLFVSCQYDNNSTAYYDVTPFKDTVKASISFPGHLLKDTITLSKKDSLRYEITISTGKMISSSFRLDTLTLKTKNNYVKIDSIFAKGKAYPLKMSLHVSTQSGSLADIKGVEGVNFKDSTMLYVKFVEAK